MRLRSLPAVLLFVVASACSPARTPEHVAPAARVRVWQDSLVLPTWEEGPPDPNAPFDVFGQKRVVYPYTMRRDFADRPIPRAWRALHLENEFLHCIVLPDLGGHLYGCTDKRNGAEMFYANKSIKLANVAYRGAWAALGIEFNFPVSHSWTTVSPVDFATTTGNDGSASISIGNVDRVYGMAWRVELVLRPNRVVLEQRTTLENPSDARHRFYWWTNAAVRAWDDTEILYPMELTASHGFTEIDTWPVSSKGVDLHVVGNHKSGPVSLFSHASHEPYMAVLQPRTRTGVAHVSSPSDLPAKKFYSWGVDGDARAWNRTLSDDESNYVEVQAGLFRNQETYGFLEPQQTIHFTEDWIPLRDLSSVSRVNTDAVLHLARTPIDGNGEIAIELTLGLTRVVPDAVITLRDESRVVSTKPKPVSLSPVVTHTQRWPGLSANARYTIEVHDAKGASVIQHTEDKYDLTPRAQVGTGPQSQVSASGDPLAAGTEKELDGRLLEALAIYDRGIAAMPNNIGLLRAAGRLAFALKQHARAAVLLDDVVRRAPSDLEAAYYLGLARIALSRDARPVLEAVQSGPWHAPALLALAALSGRDGDRVSALSTIERVVGRSTSANAINVALLRALGRNDEARRRLAAWQQRDPTNSALRYEAVRLGARDDALWQHLAGDPERIIALAADRMHFGLWADAVDVLARSYPSGEGVVSEPGMPRPEAHPLIAYYRGFCREALGQDASADFALGARSSTDLVFPNRADSIPVLERAIAKNANDATAHMLLGALLLSGGMVEPAMREWESVRRLDPRRRGVHRNLGFTILRTDGPTDRALAMFEEGITVDPENAEIWVGLDEALAKESATAAARLAALRRHPRAGSGSLPAVLVLKVALLLAKTGRFDEAERSLVGRTFGREERGVDVRGVYVDLRVTRAEALAKTRDCTNARRIVDHLTDPVEGLSFTDSALAYYASIPAIRTRTEAIARACPP